MDAVYDVNGNNNNNGWGNGWGGLIGGRHRPSAVPSALVGVITTGTMAAAVVTSSSWTALRP